MARAFQTGMEVRNFFAFRSGRVVTCCLLALIELINFEWDGLGKLAVVRSLRKVGPVLPTTANLVHYDRC